MAKGNCMKYLLIVFFVLSGCANTPVDSGTAEPVPIVDLTEAEIRAEYERAFIAALTGYTGNYYHSNRDEGWMVSMAHSVAAESVKTLGKRKALVNDYITAYSPYTAPQSQSPP